MLSCLSRYARHTFGYDKDEDFFLDFSSVKPNEKNNLRSNIDNVWFDGGGRYRSKCSKLLRARRGKKRVKSQKLVRHEFKSGRRNVLFLGMSRRVGRRRRLSSCDGTKSPRTNYANWTEFSFLLCCYENAMRWRMIADMIALDGSAHPHTALLIVTKKLSFPLF